MEKEPSSSERISGFQERLNSIYDRFIKFPPMAVEEDENGQIAETFSYPDPKENPDRIDWISGKNFLDGRIMIYYAKGKFVGQLNLKKNNVTGNVDLIKSIIYERDLHTEEKRVHSMTPARTKKGKYFKPDLWAVEYVLTTTEAKMAEDPDFFRNRLTREEEDKVAKRRQALAKASAQKRINRNKLMEKSNPNSRKSSRTNSSRRKKI